MILWGDHGYHLGEHGWWNKVTVFDIGARVPLVILAPNMAGMNRHTEAVVELVDLYPTLAELAGLEPAHELGGQSLSPLLEDPSSTWEGAAFTQVVRPTVGMGYSVRQGNWRLTQWGTDAGGGLELYAVTKDKQGYYNQANDPALSATVERLHNLLRKGYPQVDARSNSETSR